MVDAEVGLSPPLEVYIGSGEGRSFLTEKDTKEIKMVCSEDLPNSNSINTGKDSYRLQIRVKSQCGITGGYLTRGHGRKTDFQETDVIVGQDEFEEGDPVTRFVRLFEEEL